jgi:hypothetical protein
MLADHLPKEPIEIVTKSQVIPAQLLTLMHDVAVELEAHPNILLHNWGLHLMEDWRSLELLAEQYR